MNFTEEWKHIEFLEFKDDKPLPLAEVVPFIFKDKITECVACESQGTMIMIQYRLPLDLHKHLCDNFSALYGIKKKNSVIICLLVNKNDSYLKYIKIIEPLKTFLDLNTDILGLICQNLNFKDQLNLRSLCQTLKENMVYCNYENSNFLSKVGELIKECSLILTDRSPDNCIAGTICGIHDNKENCSYRCRDLHTSYNFYSTHGIYSDLKLVNDQGILKIEYSSYLNFKILGVDYNFRELLENIELIKSLSLLINLLKFDESLRNTSKCFTQKDKTLMRQHKLSSHYYKTNDCYFKFNKDLKQFFDNSEWFDVVKDIICGDKTLEYSLDELKTNIDPILEFGRKVEENYDEIKSDLSIQKREYHNGKKSRTYYENSNDYY